MSAIRMERVAHVTWERREYHPVGETREQMAACMSWVRSLGHEATTLVDDGFRYRSVYPSGDGMSFSNWFWAEAGQWLMHMVGEKQDPEMDMPHEHGPHEYGQYDRHGDWHEVPADTTEAGR